MRDSFVDKGDQCQSEGKPEQAILWYGKALDLDPWNLRALYNLGLVFIGTEEYESAIGCFEKALKVNPYFLEAHHNLSVCLQESGMFDASEACSRELLSRHPGFQEAAFNLACLSLLRGDFRTGLQGYEKRFHSNISIPERLLQMPRWDGSPLRGATILLHAEQGFGDTLQMARYVPMVKEMGGRVVLEVPPALDRLLQSVEGADLVVQKGMPLPDFQVHLPVMSLPFLFGTTLESIPAQVPYLLPEKEMVEAWAKRLKSDKFLKF